MIDIKMWVELKNLTTFGVGGKAKYFVEVKSEPDLLGALSFAKSHKLEIFILGGGSNVVISDKGFDGLVILNSILGFESHIVGNKAVVSIGSGMQWDEAVVRCVSNNWAGIESLSGIPGKVGAAPVQNIGAYGENLSDVLVEVRAIDSKTDRLVVLKNQECGFGYRKSIFNSTEKGRYIITGIKISLEVGGEPKLIYHDLRVYFEGKKPSILEVRRAVIEIRSRKGMVILPGFENYKSAGSFFKNPIVDKKELDSIRRRVDEAGGCAAPWYWPASPPASPNRGESQGGEQDDKIKISAACLIEKAGFNKGFREGNVGVSPKHTLAIINLGEAKASEIMKFSRRIQNEVKAKFSVLIELEAEPV